MSSVSRRMAMASLGAVPLTVALGSVARSSETRDARSTYVLVHGGWHGGWCWKDTAARLRADGHEVWTPTLTGLGERSHLLTRDVGLEQHVQDVVHVLEYEDLHGVVLVGHSYAGLVIAGVADRVPERLGHLVYLDAFVPEDGQSLFDLLRPERREMYRAQAQAEGEGWRVPSPPPQAFGIDDPTRAAWVATRLTPQPLASFEQPVSLGMGAATRLARSYIHCTEGPLAPSFARFAAQAQAQAEPGWRYHELKTGHDAMLTMPAELAALLQRPS